MDSTLNAMMDIYEETHKHNILKNYLFFVVIVIYPAAFFRSLFVLSRRCILKNVTMLDPFCHLFRWKFRLALGYMLHSTVW